MLIDLLGCMPCDERLVGKKTCCEYQEGDGYQGIGKDQRGQLYLGGHLQRLPSDLNLTAPLDLGPMAMWAHHGRSAKVIVTDTYHRPRWDLSSRTTLLMPSLDKG